MLALFFVLGRLLGAFCVLDAFVLVSGRFFCILERFTIDFGRVKDAPGRVLEAPTAYFSTFFHAFACARADGAQKLQMCKNHSFPEVFLGFLHIAPDAPTSKNDAKSFPKPFVQHFPTRAC